MLFNVTPSDAGRIRPNAKVSMSAGQDATGEPLGIGSVVDIAGTVDSLTRGVAVRVQQDGPRVPARAVPPMEASPVLSAEPGIFKTQPFRLPIPVRILGREKE